MEGPETRFEAYILSSWNFTDDEGPGKMFVFEGDKCHFVQRFAAKTQFFIDDEESSPEAFELFVKEKLKPLPGRVVDASGADVILHVTLRDDKEEAREVGHELILKQEDIQFFFADMPLWRKIGREGDMALRQGSAVFKARKSELSSKNLLTCGADLFRELSSEVGLIAQGRIFKSLYGENTFREAVRVDVLLATDAPELEPQRVGVPKLDGYTFVTVFEAERRDAKAVCGLMGKLLALERNCWWSGRHFRLVTVGGSSDALDLRRVVHHSEFKDGVPGEDLWVAKSVPLVKEVLEETTGEKFLTKGESIIGPTKAFIVLFSWSRGFQYWAETFLEQRKECVKLEQGSFIAPCYGANFYQQQAK